MDISQLLRLFIGNWATPFIIAHLIFLVNSLVIGYRYTFSPCSILIWFIWWKWKRNLKMDNPIRLTCKLEEEQKAFLGCILDENLLSICNEVVVVLGHAMNFIIAAMKMVLGCEFLENVNRYHVNTDITSQFLASLLYLGEERVNILPLLRMNFKP